MALGKWMMAACTAAALATGAQAAPPATSGNPILQGWYADPEAAVFAGRYWIFPTTSADYDAQITFDAFSSPDLVHWTKHADVLNARNVPWAKRAMWAPSVVENNGKYYFFFAANDIKTDSELGGIGVAVADRPEGPYKDLLGKPLVGAFHNGAQPIDQFVFKDDDGAWYMIWPDFRHAEGDSWATELPLPVGEPLLAGLTVVNEVLRAGLHRERIRPGVRFHCHEGPKVVAVGEVTRVTGLLLDRPLLR